MTESKLRKSGRLAWVAGALAPALLALAVTPTLAGGPLFNALEGGSASQTGGTGSLGGWGGEACTVGFVNGPVVPAAPDGICADFFLALPLAVGAVAAQPTGKVSSFDMSAVDTNLGLYFLADRSNVGIEVLNTRLTDPTFAVFNVAGWTNTLCQAKFTGTGKSQPAQNSTLQTYNNGPNGVVVVNSRTVWAGDGSISGNNSTIKVCSFAGTLLKTIPTGGESRAGRGCFDPVHQRVLFANDMERNFQNQTAYPFVSIYNATTYAQVAKLTLDPTHLGSAPAYIKNTYTPAATTVNTAATSGVGSCVYNPDSPSGGSFWVAVPECYNQTAQNAYLTTFIFTGGQRVQTANAGSGGDPNADHGCILDISSSGHLNAVYDVGGPQFPAGPSPTSAINGVANATYKDVCVAPLGLVLGPYPQILIGCFANGQQVPSPESTGGPPGGAAYKATVSNCNGTGFPTVTNATYTQGGTLPTGITISGTSAKLGNVNAPCMNPDYPTAILYRTTGGLYAVVTQQAGADLVAVDNGGCFDSRSCGQTGGVTRNDELEGSFGFHYFLASAAYHANGTAAAMCTQPTSGTGCFDAGATIVTGAVPTGTPAGTFVTTQYNCGSASALPGDPGSNAAAAQIPGPGLLNSLNADFITGLGQEWDPTPSPGPNTSPINNPAAINAASAGGQVPGWHTQGCSPNTSLIGSHSPSHSVAVDLITNQVFLAAPSTEVGTAQTNGMVTGQFAGWQTSSSVASLIPIDPQYPPSPKGNGGVCTPAAPCPGQQATPTVWDGFTRLCGTGIDNLGNTGSDTNGCILVLQDGP
jgi:hypothetical protein